MAVLVKTKLATDLQLDKDEPRLDFSCGGDLKVIVTVEPAETGNDSICTARGDATPPGEVASDLIGNDPGPRFMEYIRATESLLFNDYLIRTIRLFMWRRGARVDYRLPYNRDAFWSLDGLQWSPIQKHVARFEGRISIPIYQGPIPREVLADVSTLVERGDDEPLAHQLLREAFAQRTGSPHGSLVFAITAAEVGFKECVSNLVPEAGWLVENLQSPPLYRMLKEYLPLLPVKLRRTGKTLVPPDELLHEIQTGNDLRNKVSHRGHVEITAEKLDRILKSRERSALDS